MVNVADVGNPSNIDNCLTYCLKLGRNNKRVEKTANIIIELMVLGVEEEIGRSRLQKTTFLLQEEFKMSLKLAFEHSFYRPHSEELTSDIEALKAFVMIE
jgi:uncharacterized protein YwgA